MKQVISCITAATLLLAGSAFAADSASIRFLVPAALGTDWDITARSLGGAMRVSKLATDIRIDHRAGGNGIIGLNQFFNTTKGNGDALLVGGLSMIGATEFAKTPVSLKQLTPIARLTADPEVIFVSPKSKFRNLKELAEELKAGPANFIWSGGQAGNADHILVGLMAKELKIDPTKPTFLAHSYGVDALGAVLSGRATAGVASYADMQSMIQDGKVRALAVSSAKRIAVAPDTATLKEQGLNIEFVNWRGVFGGPGLTPAQRVNLVNKVTDSTASPAWQDALKRNDWTGALMTGDEFGKFVEAEVARVAQTLKDLALLQ